MNRLLSFEILFVPEEDIQHMNKEGGSKWGEEAVGVDLNIISR